VNGRDRKGRDCLVVVGPDGAAGLVISAGKILVEANALIGLVAPGGLRARLSFRDCTCGRRRKCVCGARRGQVRFTADGDAWMVVDDEGHEFGRITLSWSAMSREDTRAGGTAATLARWVRAARLSSSRGPMGFELVEVGPGFDWRRDGLFVALTVLCDSHAYHRVFPQRGG
jgi:hypothetical protein